MQIKQMTFETMGEGDYLALLLNMHNSACLRQPYIHRAYSA